MTHIPFPRRLVAPVAAFVLVAAGAFLALPRSDESATADTRVPTLVAVAPIAKGSLTGEIAGQLEVRLLEPEARAEGALSSLEELPAGVIAVDLVVGQQMLISSVNDDQLSPVGDGYVAVSVRLDPQRWAGPLAVTGKIVDVYDIVDGEARRVATRAVVVDAPAGDTVAARDEAIVTLAVDAGSLTAVLVAADSGRIWLVGA